MSERERDGARGLDRPKQELVRALRRRAAELAAEEQALQERGGSRHCTPTVRSVPRRVRTPRGRQAHQVAFFGRQPLPPLRSVTADAHAS